MRWHDIIIVLGVVSVTGATASADDKVQPEAATAKPAATARTAATTRPAATTKSVRDTKTVLRQQGKKPCVITGKEAVAIVTNLPEVKKWAEGIRKLKRQDVSASIDLDRTEGDTHVVHVYESVMDTPEQGHTATFNWYSVNSKTRKITKEF
jgi:hypothetical protein